MLSVNNRGQIEFSIDYLQDDELKTLDQVVARYENFDPTLFYHIVSSPTCRYESKFGKNRILSSIAGISAEQRFKKILYERVIYGNPKSFFVNKTNSSVPPSQIDDIKSVSFTLSSMQDLPSHFDARDSQYGICFFHDFLLNKGIRQVIYLNDQSSTDQAKIVFNSPHLIEIYNKNYDMRWENEWRVINNLPFEISDVAFLIVPDGEYERLNNEFNDDKRLEEYPFLIPSSVYNSPLSHLFTIQHDDRTGLAFGRQIPLFRMPDGGGELLLDMDEFMEILPEERREFNLKAGVYLRALARSTIHECYEYRFARRFIRFIERLDESYWGLSCLPDIGRLKRNEDEPWRSCRDLTIACYEILFKIQQPRITAEWFKWEGDIGNVDPEEGP